MEGYDWPPRGFLSYNPEDERVDDRQYLVGEYDPEKKADPDGWMQTRDGRIQKRTKAAIRDFGMLFQELDAERRESIFTGDHDQPHKRGGNPLKPNQDLSDVEGDFEWDFLGGWKAPNFRPTKGDEELIHAIADTVAFLWLGCYDAHVNPEEVIETGINRAMEEINRCRSAEVSVVPDVHIERRQSMAIRARKKIERGEELIDAEARALLDQAEEIVPAGIVFDYLRGDIDSYEIPPLPFEDTDNKQLGINIEPEITDEEREEALDDEFAVKDGTIIYGNPPPEIDEETRDAVIDALGYRDFIEMAVEGLESNNESIDAPVPAATFLDWLHTLHEEDLEPLADEAEVSVATLQRVLSRDNHRIKSRLASEYDNIGAMSGTGPPGRGDTPNGPCDCQGKYPGWNFHHPQYCSDSALDFAEETLDKTGTLDSADYPLLGEDYDRA